MWFKKKKILTLAFKPKLKKKVQTRANGAHVLHMQVKKGPVLDGHRYRFNTK